MPGKRWIAVLLIIVMCTICGFAGVQYICDPMLRYGHESWPLTYYEYSEMYSNPGIARNYKYDAVMVGTSMIENTNVDQCDELFGVKMVRLPYSGGTTYNMKTILDICFSSKNDIKKVYWELDEFQLFGSATEPRYPLPMYMYQENHIDDLKYLLNIDLFYHYTLKDIVGTLTGRTQNLERRGVTLNGEFGQEAMLRGYARPQKADTEKQFEQVYKKKVDANLENIRLLIEAHPETEFVFFLPPFSVLYWDAELCKRQFDANMDGAIYAIGELLQYKNVSVYYFQNDEEIITNLDNYKDYSHYGSWINDLLTEKMAMGVGQVTEDNYVTVVEGMRQFIKSYNFEQYFQ